MIPQNEPLLGEEEIKELRKAINSQNLYEGALTAEFEALLAKQHNVKFAVACSNSTAAFYLAIKSADFYGDILTSDLAFIGIASAISLAGASPVFMDVDKLNFNILPEQIEDRATSRTGTAIIGHAFGQPSDMDRVMGIMKARGYRLIEDCSGALGSSFAGRKVGSFGIAGVVGFWPGGIITTGEGAAVLTDDEGIADMVRELKHHGRAAGQEFHREFGFNFVFTELQAAVGLAQLKRVDEIKRRKKEILKQYRQELGGISSVVFPKDDTRCQYTPQFVNILVDDSGAMKQHLEKHSIATQRFFQPMHREPEYEVEAYFEGALYAYDHGLSLPSGAGLTEDQVSFVCKNVKDFFK